jgi:hypothetical protein
MGSVRDGNASAAALVGAFPSNGICCVREWRILRDARWLGLLLLSDPNLGVKQLCWLDSIRLLVGRCCSSSALAQLQLFACETLAARARGSERASPDPQAEDAMWAISGATFSRGRVRSFRAAAPARERLQRLLCRDRRHRFSAHELQSVERYELPRSRVALPALLSWLACRGAFLPGQCGPAP